MVILGGVMYKIFKAIILIIWVLDIVNIPQLEMLDTTYPINTLAWFLILLLIPSGENGK